LQNIGDSNTFNEQAFEKIFDDIQKEICSGLVNKEGLAKFIKSFII
jgi:hypothetical protein